MERKIGEHWMDPDERLLWAASGSGRVAPAASVRKLSPSRLGAMLVDACDVGDLAGVRSALAGGANPNFRARPKPRCSAVQVALNSGHGAVAMEVARAGGWVAPVGYYSRDEEGMKAFDAAALAGPLEGDMRVQAIKDTMNSFVSRAESWQIIAAAAAWCAPQASLGSLLPELAALGRIDRVHEAVGAGVPMSAVAWKAIGKFYADSYYDIKSHPDRDGFLALIADPSSAASIEAPVAAQLYAAAVRHDDPALMLALLDAGLRPSPDWRVDRNGHHFRRGSFVPEIKDRASSLVVACAEAGANGELFEIAKRCAPAMAAARSQKDSPWMMCDMSISRLMELAELGVPIDGVDSKGEGLAHAWARVSDAPRAGWATLAHKHPDVFGHKNKEGKIGSEIMAAKIRDQEGRDEFMASITRIESREIRREIGPKKAAAPAPKRQRL